MDNYSASDGPATPASLGFSDLPQHVASSGISLGLLPPLEMLLVRAAWPRLILLGVRLRSALLRYS